MKKLPAACCESRAHAGGMHCALQSFGRQTVDRQTIEARATRLTAQSNV
jgi:hypothetical protein